MFESTVDRSERCTAFIGHLKLRGLQVKPAEMIQFDLHIFSNRLVETTTRKYLGVCCGPCFVLVAIVACICGMASCQVRLSLLNISS